MQVSLDMTDAMELEQLLGFLAGWMKSDRDYLAPSLPRFLGVEVAGLGPESLADDFNRFRFRRGATDGEGGPTPDDQKPHARRAGDRRRPPTARPLTADTQPGK